MEWFASQDPRSYSLYFDLNIWFRARKVTGTFEKRALGPLYRAGSAQALFPHKVVVVFIWEDEAEIPVARVEISASGSAPLLFKVHKQVSLV